MFENDDPLLECLVALTQFFDRPYSRESLRAGLPLTGSVLTPQLFVRAAERAGLAARIVARPFDKISKLVLPVVLILHDKQACILHKIHDDGTVEVTLSQNTGGIIRKPQTEIKELYTGYVIFIQPVFQREQNDEEKTERPKEWFWGTLWKYRRNYGEVALAALFVNIFSLVSPLFVMNVYDRVVPNNATLTLWVLSIGVLIIFTFDVTLRILRGYLIDVCGKKADTLMAGYLFRQILDLQLIHKPRSVGAFVNNLREFESVREFFTSATFVTLIDLPFLILFLLLIWYVGGVVVLVPLIGVPTILGAAWLLEIPLRKVVQQALHGMAQKNAILVESISGLETVKTLVAEGLLQRKWEQQVGHTGGLGLKSRFLSALVTNFAYYVQQITYVATVVVGVYLIEAHELTLGGLIACTILSGRSLAPLGQLTGMLTRYQQAKIALKGLNTMMALPNEHPQGKRYIHHGKLSGEIEFSNISFQYPDQNGLALDNLNFKIKAGERIAIMGRIGSGKTTLQKLLLNLYQPQKGLIYLDGIDEKQMDPVDIRHNIAYVPQESILFSGTLRDNIVMGKPWATDAAILQAAQIAGLDQVVNRHPLGFDMPVGERGETFSGGQRQSVTIARAVVSNPSILLLDEPTSAMDDRSEQELIGRLKQYLTDKTLLLITHRLSLLTLVDRIIVLDHGKIIMDGPKEEVLKRFASPAPAATAPAKTVQGARWS
ncbi:MAG: type I secretion system permease/ATPase [Proteobacteria bacterium]|nr:type I secretion system permease/ATPase [Pseudomonadota bacterium]